MVSRGALVLVLCGGLFMSACGSASVAAPAGRASSSTGTSSAPPRAPADPAPAGPASKGPVAPSLREIKAVMASTVEVGIPGETFKLDLKPVTVTDGHGGWLTAAHGTRFPTADAYGQLIFFWHNKTFIGWDSTGESMQSSIASSGPGFVTVSYAHYGPKDPVCCPTLRPVRITYRWTGSRLAASGTPPTYGKPIQVKLKK